MSNKLMTNEQVNSAMSGMSGKMGEAKSQQAMTRELLDRALEHLAVWSDDWEQGPDFTRMDLSGFSFRDMALIRANFEWSDLSFANFEGADIGGAMFLEVDLTGASFKGVDFTGAGFHNVRCDFSCDLTGATFDSEEQKEEITKLLTV